MPPPSKKNNNQKEQKQAQQDDHGEHSNDELYTLLWLLFCFWLMVVTLKQGYNIRVQTLGSVDRDATSTKYLEDVDIALNGDDAYFHYRATEYLYEHGIYAFYTNTDSMTWYPFGRLPVGRVLSSNPIGLPFLAVFIKKCAFFACYTIHDICCYIPVWYGVLSILLVGMMTYECCSKIDCFASEKEEIAVSKKNSDKNQSFCTSSEQQQQQYQQEEKKLEKQEEKQLEKQEEKQLEKQEEKRLEKQEQEEEKQEEKLEEKRQQQQIILDEINSDDDDTDLNYIELSTLSPAKSWSSVAAVNFSGSTILTFHSPALECSLFSMFIMALIPGHLKISLLGRYNNECFAVFCMHVTFYFWIRSFQSILSLNEEGRKNNKGPGSSSSMNSGGSWRDSSSTSSFGSYANIFIFFMAYLCLITTNVDTNRDREEGWDPTMDQDAHDDLYYYYDNIYSIYVFHMIIVHAIIIMLTDLFGLFVSKSKSERIICIKSIKNFAIIIVIVLLFTFRTIALLPLLRRTDSRTDNQNNDETYLRTLLPPFSSLHRHRELFLHSNHALKKVLVNMQLAGLILPFGLITVICQLFWTRRSDFLKSSFLIVGIFYALYLNSLKRIMKGEADGIDNDRFVSLMASTACVLVGLFSGKICSWSVQQWWKDEDEEHEQNSQETSVVPAEKSEAFLGLSLSMSWLTFGIKTESSISGTNKNITSNNSRGKQNSPSNKRNECRKFSATKTSSRKEKASKSENSTTKNNDNRKKKKSSCNLNSTATDPGKALTSKRVAALIVFVLCYCFLYMFSWMSWYISGQIITDEITERSDSIITIENHINNMTKYIIDDYREAYTWIRENTPEDSRVLAWSDHGFHINALSNRTSIADNNYGKRKAASQTDHEHRALLGMAFTSPLDDGYELIQHLADYVLIYNGRTEEHAITASSQTHDDLDKSINMMRIADSVYNLNLCEVNDVTCPSFFGYVDNLNKVPSRSMAQSLIYRLHSQGLVEGVHGDPSKFQIVHRTKNGKVRIYKVINPSAESKAWTDTPFTCDTNKNNNHNTKVTRSLPPPAGSISGSNLPMPGMPIPIPPMPGDRMHGKATTCSSTRSSSTTSTWNNFCPRQYPPGLLIKINDITKKLRRLRENMNKAIPSDKDATVTYRQRLRTRQDVYNTWEDNQFTRIMWKLITTNSVEEIRHMFRRDPLLPFVRSSDGRGPMWWAHEQHTEDIIEMLKEVGVPHTDVDRNGMLPEDLI